MLRVSVKRGERRTERTISRAFSEMKAPLNSSGPARLAELVQRPARSLRLSFRLGTGNGLSRPRATRAPINSVNAAGIGRRPLYTYDARQTLRREDYGRQRRRQRRHRRDGSLQLCPTWIPMRIAPAISTLLGDGSQMGLPARDFRE